MFDQLDYFDLALQNERGLVATIVQVELAIFKKLSLMFERTFQSRTGLNFHQFLFHLSRASCSRSHGNSRPSFVLLQ
jgi:hypothetical protein